MRRPTRSNRFFDALTVEAEDLAFRALNAIDAMIGDDPAEWHNFSVCTSSRGWYARRALASVAPTLRYDHVELYSMVVSHIRRG